MAHPPVQHYEIDGISCEKRGPSSATQLIFSHGIEAGKNDGMTQDVAEGFAETSPIVTWDGTRSLSERIASFHKLIAAHEKSENAKPSLGGRSMGARAAVSTALAREGADGALVLVSWPLWAGKRGERREPERREKILLDLPAGTDVLFVLGSRDLQCPLPVFAEFRTRLAARSWVVAVEGADHRMELAHREAERPVRMMTGRVAAEWLRSRDVAKRDARIEWDEQQQSVKWSGWA